MSDPSQPAVAAAADAAADAAVSSVAAEAPTESVSAAPHLRRLLDLLADGAPAEALGAVSSQARAAGVAAGDLAEVERATATALRIRGALRQHRRRELQLTALFDTAGDLAASRELDDVLKAIVRRARMLLGTDTAYLTLPDEEAGDTYMRVTDGSVSVVFQRLRLELGEGLGGLVAQTARPYATHDYRTDDRFRHTRNINAGVLDEGLVAILGVPLLLGSSRGGTGKVIGVLFAADRAPRVFSPDEVALLCSLAAHAAIAIDTARALADTRSALDGLAAANAELAQANAAVRAHSAAMRRAEESHDQLTDLVLRGRDVKDVAASVAALLDSPLTIHDPGGRPLAAVRPDGADFAADSMDAGWLAETAEESRTGARAVHRDGRWICAVLAGQELMAGLVLHRRAPLDDSDRRLFERASVVTGLLLLLRRTVAETENRVRGELITDLLTDAADRDPAGLVERGRRLGIDLDRPHLLLLADGGARGRLAPAAVRYLFGGDLHGVSAEHHGQVVVLVAADGPGADARGAARAAAAQLGQLVQAPVTVAAAGPARGVRELAQAYGEAVRCLRAMRVLGRTGEGACVEELGFLGVVLGNGQNVDGFVTATLGPLLEYDAQRGTHLVRTLRAYFGSGGSLVRAKDELHVHVNTVVQRLDRVQVLLGHDWNEPGRALEIQLALKLHQLAGSAGG